ncbi:sugar ABC transporter ATP-binding protein [Nitratireductor mangrovi]|uniref:Sugar ABC transporter ATP-binding protein n=1 Tax=Nitratireductor mangrovi TaxID=2599600 RepID=A0A5B8L0D4_9HYPH|nr:sugar ABC transporter ATP-binding protein [Nitratireductor mangrovi]QDZ01341.1 sugar ABC transporter ATP-binding protein [Nitratireductor mangrovi]
MTQTKAGAVEPILRMRRIGKQFPGVVALAGVDLDVRPGEVHGLVGENGAGKSTLMKILSGAYQADTGEIQVDGETIAKPNPLGMIGRGVAVIYQEMMQARHLTVAENLFLGRLPRTGLGTVDWQSAVRQSAEVMTRLGFAVDPRARLDTLSVAQRQMVEIAKALSRDARLVILDEPSAVLGGSELDKLFAVIRRLSAAGVALIYISHRLHEVFAVCDVVTVLRDGSVVGTRPVADIDAATIIRMMVGRQLSDVFPERNRQPGDTVLSARGLTRPGVLRDIDIDVRAGEILGVCGMAGSGRTELLRALVGADAAACRSYRLNGTEGRPANPRAAIARGILLLPEDRKTEGCFLPQSVAFNITVSRLSVLMQRGMLNEARERDVVGQLVRQLGIRTPEAGTRISNLSGGNQQKCMLARSLNADCAILLIDEPTRGVDVGAKREIYQLLAMLADRQHTAIIIVSSELPEILGLCDRVVVMRDGMVAARFDHDEATEELIVAAAVGEPAAKAA